VDRERASGDIRGFARMPGKAAQVGVVDLPAAVVVLGLEIQMPADSLGNALNPIILKTLAAGFQDILDEQVIDERIGVQPKLEPLLNC